jgi:hypothetical protein
MLRHGHLKAEFRHWHLHQVALEKLRLHPELMSAVRALLEQWLKSEALLPSRPWLQEWQAMLTHWSFEKLCSTVLDWKQGQVLRQCSPLGPVPSPQERWAALAEADRQFDQQMNT